MTRRARLGSASFILLAPLALGACGGDVTTEGGAGAGSATSATGAGTTSGGGETGTGGASSTSSTSTTGSAATTTTSTTGSATTTSSSTGGGNCGDCAANGTSCCGDGCRNLNNDIFNCGECGHECTGTHPFCNGGTCGEAPCYEPGLACKNGFCCGQVCCADGQLCCDVAGPGPSTGPKCVDAAANGGTCPVGCPLCK
jgi:hypothetical protein